jgi:glycerate 2-kinase
VRRNLRIRRGRLEVPGRSHPLGRGRVVVVAAGKAAGPMAAAAEEVLGDHLDHGLAVCPTATVPLRRTELRLAGHPLPDVRGQAAADEVESLVSGLGPHDILLLLLSGGASALLPAPAGSLSLKDKALTTSLLLKAGASIGELNAVRKHLSRLKGGGLARLAAPAHVSALVLSDVVGDDLSTIASGMAAPDPTTYGDALDVLAARGVARRVPARVRAHLQAGAGGRRAETAKAGDPVFRRVHATVVGSNRRSMAAAGQEARRQGLRPLILTTRLQGEAREVARVLVAILEECTLSGRPAAPPVCLLAGGETTVTVRGKGRGGRNQELAVAAATPLSRLSVPAVLASLATDGVDGDSDAAGGVVDGSSARRARALGLAPPEAFLAASDSRSFLASLGDLILTGPTGTNVSDVTVLVAGGPGRGTIPG